MINSIAFAKRLRIIMEYYTLNSSSLAERIGVQRSGISHILAGRNKPSLDFVLKVIGEFKEVDLYWLLMGRGSFPPADTNDEIVASKEGVSKIPDILPSVPPATEEKIQASKNSQKADARISRIIILYKNGRFDSFEN